jgi:UDP-glucose:(heptosyl)LPS alpha-1,3-glucosyltransferase
VYHPHAGLARANVAKDSALDRLLNPRRARGAAVEGQLLESTNPPVVLCLSEYVKRAVRQWYKLDETQLPILFNAVDLEKYDPAARPHARATTRSKYNLGEEQCVALFIGQDFERKGLREAVSALGNLRNANDSLDANRLMLVIVGRPRADKYLALARRTGVHEQVLKLGHTDDAYAFYRAADFLVLPTKHDPCSLVVLEALATGLPVVSTRFNGACEIMTDGVHGFVLDDPTDMELLSQAMGRMLDPQLRRRMSKACLELRPRLAYENHLGTLLEIYRQITNERK